MLHYREKSPYHAYLTNNLLLPKAYINVEPIKAALTFDHGEEKIFDEDTNEVTSVRIGKIEMWDETSTHLIVPREFLSLEERDRFQFDFIDHSHNAFDEVDIESMISPRDSEQAEAFQALLENPSGTLNLACGKGKTIAALMKAATLRVPTMIVVNTGALLEQWKLEIGKHLNVKSIGTVQGETIDWEGHPIVLAMVHTLALHRDKWPVEFRRRFGLVFYDEGHHMSAPLFVRSADLSYGIRHSLTATAERTDGLEAIYQYHLGRVFYSDLKQELIPKTFFHVLKWQFDIRDKEYVTDVTGSVSMPKVRSYLGRLDWRNELIYDDLLLDLSEGRTILVLSHSVDHVDRLTKYFPGSGGAIMGRTPQEDRMPILHQCNPVFGTFQLAREGLDKPSLDTLYITTPHANKNDLQQTVGRIQRRHDSKLPPIVRIYEDTAFPECSKACRALKTHMKATGYPHRRVNVEINQ